MNSTRVLVTGGAGYVGSTVAVKLQDLGYEVWVLDQYSTGYRELVYTPNRLEGAIGDTALIDQFLKSQAEQGKPIHCVMHFAALCIVSESVREPTRYYENNVSQSERFIETLIQNDVQKIVFSSSCAVYGTPEVDLITERTPFKPLHPYGETKLETERYLQKLCEEKKLNAISLRYFNAAGNDPLYRTGELHDPETHLIPNIIRAVSESRAVSVYGEDYPTPDGTCIRDYVSVNDLAAAHIAAMKKLLALDSPTGKYLAYNVGSGRGYSVKEVIQATERVLGKKIKINSCPRRPSDPPKLVADISLSKKELGFEPKESLEKQIEAAATWYQKRRKAVFLDRDGTLNEDPGYLSDPKQLKLLPGVGESLCKLKQAGFLLVVVSNQSGIARGLIKPETLPLIHEKLQALLSPYRVQIDHFEICTHHPNENCECRKPKPELLVRGSKTLHINLKDSYMVGDKSSDVLAGKNAKCKGSFLLLTGEGKFEKDQPEQVFPSLVEAVDFILKNSESQKP